MLRGLFGPAKVASFDERDREAERSKEHPKNEAETSLPERVQDQGSKDAADEESEQDSEHGRFLPFVFHFLMERLRVFVRRNPPPSSSTPRSDASSQPPMLSS